jgi:chromosome partitioning protein
MTVIPVLNNKGGVAKTTTAVNLAAGLARAGAQVLLVDFDSQASASLALGVNRSNLQPSVADVLYGEVPIRNAVRSTGRKDFHLLTSSLDLANADVRLAPMQNRHQRFKAVLDEVRDAYDFILVDCAPSTSLLSINAMVAADGFIVPVAPSYLSLEGVVSLGEIIQQAQASFGSIAPVLGILLTMVEGGDDEVQEIISQIRKHYGKRVFSTEIERNVELEDAPGAGETIFEHAPSSAGALDYAELTREVMQRVERYQKKRQVSGSSMQPSAST